MVKLWAIKGIACDDEVVCILFKGAYFFYVDTEGGGGVRKMPILLNKMSTKGGRGGQKSLKSCLRRKSMTPLAKLYHQRFFIKKIFCHSRQFRILSYFLLTVPGKTSKTDRNSCSHQLCECDREFAMCLQKYLPCPKSKAVCKNKKRLWQNLLMGFGSGKGVHDPKHKVCCLPSGFVCVTIL